MIGPGIPILPEHPLHSRIAARPDRLVRAESGPSSSSLFVPAFTGSGFMLRNGGEMSNFTTGMTPRYWARTMGCELPDWPEGVRGCASRTSVIAPKQSKTPIRRRNLKNADWEADFFFIGWSLG